MDCHQSPATRPPRPPPPSPGTHPTSGKPQPAEAVESPRLRSSPFAPCQGPCARFVQLRQEQDEEETIEFNVLPRQIALDRLRARSRGMQAVVFSSTRLSPMCSLQSLLCLVMRSVKQWQQRACMRPPLAWRARGLGSAFSRRARRERRSQTLGGGRSGEG